MKKFLLIPVLFTLFSIGCSSLIPDNVTKAAIFTDKKGYIYGRFGFKQINGSFPVGVIVMNVNTKMEHFLKFSDDNDICCIIVEPGTYKVMYLAAIVSDNDQKSDISNNVKYRPSSDFIVEPGKAFYIGDILGYKGRTINGKKINFSWGISSVADNYKATTDEFKKEYPNLIGIPTESVLNK